MSMPRPLTRSPPAEDAKDPYYYLLVGMMWISALTLVWLMTPWFPWR